MSTANPLRSKENEIEFLVDLVVCCLSRRVLAARQLLEDAPAIGVKVQDLRTTVLKPKQEMRYGTLATLACLLHKVHGHARHQVGSRESH